MPVNQSEGAVVISEGGMLSTFHTVAEAEATAAVYCQSGERHIVLTGTVFEFEPEA